nr:transposase [Mesorhizobium onobrychidis]
MTRLAMIREQIKAIEEARLARLEQAPVTGATCHGASDCQRHRHRRRDRRYTGAGGAIPQPADRRAVARYAGLTGAPDESGSKRWEKGSAKAGNARVRRGLVQLAWRFLRFQNDSALAQWFRARTDGPSGMRKTKMIVALARKLLIALWRVVTIGDIPASVALRQPA